MMKLRPLIQHDPWSLAEAVDLPLALEDERFSPNREADLTAAREDIGGETNSADPAENRDVMMLRAWLQRWQRKAKENTPGEWIEDVLRNAGRIALVVGVLFGLGSGSDRLFFTGGEPLNVFFLVGVFVLLPLLLSATLLLTVALRQPDRGNALQQFFIFLARKLTRAAAIGVLGIPCAPTPRGLRSPNHSARIAIFCRRRFSRSRKSWRSASGSAC